MPWAGHSARYALADLYDAITAHKTTLLFVNTRSQAEMLFQELWRINEDALPIALHHGSLDVGAAAQGRGGDGGGRLRAVVCTSTLDLGIDWGDVDLVVQCRRAEGREPARRSASAAPTTASTSRRRRSSCRPTASRCWNAGRRSMR